MTDVTWRKYCKKCTLMWKTIPLCDYSSLRKCYIKKKVNWKNYLFEEWKTLYFWVTLRYWLQSGLQ